MFLLKNRNDPKLSEANFHARLCHLKQLLKNIHPMILASFLFTDEKMFTVTIPKKPRRMTDCMFTNQPIRRKTSWQNACAHVQSLMASNK